MEGLHGDFSNSRDGLHAGNQFRTTIYNDGTFGRKQDPPDIAGEWPINSGRWYMIDGNVFVGSEVIDANNELQHMVSTVTSAGDGSSGAWSSGDTDPVTGEWWTFLPLPGFANEDTNKVAMSKWKWAWPNFWPDKFEDPVDPGWSGKWNGYFGKDIFNADEESFFVADDYNFKEFKFFPDTTDSSRRGLGIRMWVRGFQWSNALVEDALFALFDLENIGTYDHDKMVFGYKFGNNMGDSSQGGDGGDDSGAFNREMDVAYLFDYDDIGAGGWSPVGYFGGVFLESPGNPFDGIDNDGDGSMGSGDIIDETMFEPKTINAGDDIVLIDYTTFERTLSKMGSDTLFVHYQDQTFKFWPGKSVQEVPHNLVDDNLNGVIDESNGAEVGEGVDAVRTYQYVGLKYINYFTGAGLDNLLLDEKRDDFIDNDGDWDVLTDDLGLDGVAFSGDPGEGDGLPTSGAGTDFPGEPHIDKTDIDETDMLGLSSFKLYEWPDIPHYEDELVWENITPGYYDDLLENINVELLYGSGYFPMKPGQIERFSMGILCGSNLDDYLTNTYWVAKAYNENYNFSKAPNIPTVTAIPGDGQVTLLWDTFAEESIDPITGEDFEGYRIYRSTDPGWGDMLEITDGQGSATYLKPLVQFDLDNEFSGYAEIGIKGIRFDLGNNTGLVHTWTDTTVTNGQKYYYAVTSYDRGQPDAGIAPTECSKFISISTSGAVDKGSNVAIVRPEAPVAGFENASFSDVTIIEGGDATGNIGYKIINPLAIKENNTYRVAFEDTLVDGSKFSATFATKSISVIDMSATPPDTIINKNPNVMTGDILPIVDGFQLQLQNLDEMKLDSINSMWNYEGIYAFTFDRFRYSRTEGTPMANNYRIDFGEVGIGTSIELPVSQTNTLPATPVNFTVTNLATGEPVQFGFWERDVLEGEEGMFTGYTDRTRTDEIIFVEPNENDSLIITWDFKFEGSDREDSLKTNPKSGDYAIIRMLKPFMADDVYEFTTTGQGVNNALVDLDRIKVVPNPYVVANSWEPLNPYTNGRGPRELHFTHLPEKCTVRIFNVRGQLVRELEHHAESITDGTMIWDMQTKDLLDISYGIYIYHVDAGDLGSKIGKFAVIK
jgi:hypothetical protein